MPDYLPAEQFVGALMAGTDRMMANRRPDCTLREIFEETFYPAARIDRGEFRVPGGALLPRDLPSSAQADTTQTGRAQALVEQALARGYDLVHRHRSRLSPHSHPAAPGLGRAPPEKYPFRLIPSYERMHFTKSETAYYAELLAWHRLAGRTGSDGRRQLRAGYCPGTAHGLAVHSGSLHKAILPMETRRWGWARSEEVLGLDRTRCLPNG